MSKLIKIYITSFLGPIALFYHKKYLEFFISVFLLLAVFFFYFATGRVDVFKFLLLIYFLFNTPFTLFTLLSKHNDPNRNIYNGLMAFLFTSLFACALIAGFNMLNINANTLNGIYMQIIALLGLNFFVIYLNDDHISKQKI